MRSITKNKIAYLEYEIDSTYEVGIVLAWHEVKSIKLSMVNIRDGIVTIRDGIPTITNMDVALYPKTPVATVPWYQSKGSRKLLLKKAEISKLITKTNKTGLALIPLELRENKYGIIKLTIGLAKLRKKAEKKQVLKERDIERQAQRDIATTRF